MGYSLWGSSELDTTEQLSHSLVSKSIFRHIDVVGCTDTLFQYSILLCILHHVIFAHSEADGHLFTIWAITNNVALNMGVQICFQVSFHIVFE